MLRAVGVGKRYPIEGAMGFRIAGWVEAVKDVNLTIGAGESVGLAGESGSGKSTLARLIGSLENLDAGRIFWTQESAERPAEMFSPLERAGLCQIIFQDPTASLNPRLPVGAILQEALDQRRRLEWFRQKRREPEMVTDILNLRGLLQTAGLPPETAAAFPHQLSGGQKQRVCIARAIALTPRLLIGDEPVSALDVSVQAQILELLLALRKRLGMAILWISHDLALLGAVTERLYVMKEGRIVEEGPTAELLRRPKQAYTRLLVEATPVLR